MAMPSPVDPREQPVAAPSRDDIRAAAIAGQPTAASAIGVLLDLYPDAVRLISAYQELEQRHGAAALHDAFVQVLEARIAHGQR